MKWIATSTMKKYRDLGPFSSDNIYKAKAYALIVWSRESSNGLSKIEFDRYVRQGKMTVRNI